MGVCVQGTQALMHSRRGSIVRHWIGQSSNIGPEYSFEPEWKTTQDVKIRPESDHGEAILQSFGVDIGGYGIANESVRVLAVHK